MIIRNMICIRTSLFHIQNKRHVYTNPTIYNFSYFKAVGLAFQGCYYSYKQKYENSFNLLNQALKEAEGLNDPKLINPIKHFLCLPNYKLKKFNQLLAYSTTLKSTETDNYKNYLYSFYIGESLFQTHDVKYFQKIKYWFNLALKIQKENGFVKTKPKGYPNLYNSIMMVNLIIIDLNEKNYEEALKKIKEYYYQSSLKPEFKNKNDFFLVTEAAMLIFNQRNQVKKLSEMFAIWKAIIEQPNGKNQVKFQNEKVFTIINKISKTNEEAILILIQIQIKAKRDKKKRPEFYYKVVLELTNKYIESGYIETAMKNLIRIKQILKIKERFEDQYNRKLQKQRNKIKKKGLQNDTWPEVYEIIHVLQEYEKVDKNNETCKSAKITLLNYFTNKNDQNGINIIKQMMKEQTGDRAKQIEECFLKQALGKALQLSLKEYKVLKSKNGNCLPVLIDIIYCLLVAQNPKQLSMFLTLIENQYKDNLNEAQSYIYIFCKVFKLAGEGKTQQVRKLVPQLPGPFDINEFKKMRRKSKEEKK